MKNKTLKCCLTAGTAFLILTLSSPGTVVALYDFPGIQGTTLPSASTDSEASSTAGDLNLGAGLPLTGTNSSGISNSSGNPVNSLFLRNVNNSTEGNAVTGNKYITFSVTPSSALNFTSLSFDYFLASASSAEFFALRSDAGGDNFTTTIASGTLTTINAWTANTPLDLSSVTSLQNTGSTVNFRFYVWGAAAITDITRFDNITLNASVVPEPGTTMLFGLGSIALLVWRRFRAC